LCRQVKTGKKAAALHFAETKPGIGLGDQAGHCRKSILLPGNSSKVTKRLGKGSEAAINGTKTARKGTKKPFKGGKLAKCLGSSPSTAGTGAGGGENGTGEANGQLEGERIYPTVKTEASRAWSHTRREKR